ncbi:hypothetical protein BJ166DRAFT_21712 [Pestalotiopsis sp. NC0098]|nr:hypothetical protein BJ166DRAFT_21712 [Pestalotiopsis sp. NC0098]
MVLGVRDVAEKSSIEAALVKRAMHSINRRGILRDFKTAMLQSVPDALSKPSVGNSQINLGLASRFGLPRLSHRGNRLCGHTVLVQRFVLRVAVLCRDGMGESNMMAAIGGGG